ncbi:hypothetical protein T492DRAFT_1112273 [Pavlovales sp. CCMP2436]|nr:hypothetical protein T492DRAFT_1112273 [Pavlovales sp. CCMP2436]|mmetsp:Transcript_12410/g.31400  ORF Transcript_12410/g.31400 Transcript_12410/m.31400 type:complete len:288 (+) Transcript_12410:449-1312(+)
MVVGIALADRFAFDEEPSDGAGPKEGGGAGLEVWSDAPAEPPPAEPPPPGLLPRALSEAYAQFAAEAPDERDQRELLSHTSWLTNAAGEQVLSTAHGFLAQGTANAALMRHFGAMLRKHLLPETVQASRSSGLPLPADLDELLEHSAKTAARCASCSRRRPQPLRALRRHLGALPGGPRLRRVHAALRARRRPQAAEGPQREAQLARPAHVLRLVRRSRGEPRAARDAAHLRGARSRARELRARSLRRAQAPRRDARLRQAARTPLVRSGGPGGAADHPDLLGRRRA